MTRLEQRLTNWAAWLLTDNQIGPDDCRCVSIESRYIAEAGEIWENDPPPPKINPDVADAEALNKLITQLDTMEQWALAMRWAGAPAVFRPNRRVSHYNLNHLADNAERWLFESIKKIA